MTLVVTERLRLTTLTRDEAAAIREGRRDGRTWAADYPGEGDLVVAGVVGEAGEHYDEAAVYGVMQVRLASTGEAVGGIGFISAPDPEGTAEIGYGLVESARGQGFATEAVEAVAHWAAGQSLHALVAMTDPDNTASQRVLERCGFTRNGTVEDPEDGLLLRWERVLG